MGLELEDVVGVRNLSLDTMYLFSKYRSLDIEGRLRHGYPFVLRHRNIADYLEGRDPLVLNDSRKIREGAEAWKKIVSLVDSFSTARPSEVPVEKWVVLGLRHGATVLVASEIPELPRIPRYFGYVVPGSGEGALVERRQIGNMKRVYIEILRALTRAVVLKERIEV